MSDIFDAQIMCLKDDGGPHKLDDTVVGRNDENFLESAQTLSDQYELSPGCYALLKLDEASACTTEVFFFTVDKSGEVTPGTKGSVEASTDVTHWPPRPRKRNGT